MRPRIDLVLERIATAELNDPTWSTVLLGVTDEFAQNRCDTIPNNDDVLQLQTGFPAMEDLTPANDAAILAGFLAQIKTAIHHCGLTAADTEHLYAIISENNSDG
ncbi:hypothetical protein [Rubripirellula reticaptiva]|uniref:hypothetical protein n=1 Tax=Rubripirellula reticaptiva TaxID=2528013 RepID=UPI001C944735|nr:hypothetical protein [Rubripirellula reticaptiva]